jgi:hypothetical protein
MTYHQKRTPLHAGEIMLGHFVVDAALDGDSHLAQQESDALGKLEILASVVLGIPGARRLRLRGCVGGHNGAAQFRCHGSNMTA